jgi:protein-S-isoprenylcysteine O-methyltransferase Ste14
MADAVPTGPVGRALAWLGGAAFVASLGVFAWCYAVRYSQPGAGAVSGVRGAIAANVALFTIFALHHSVMARTGAKRWLTRYIPQALERTAYVWVGSLLFAWTCLAWQTVPGVLYRLEGPARFACMGLQLLGAWLTVRSAAVVDVLELGGIKQAMGWPTAPALKIVGPYYLVRHPIYLGWTVITFGTPTMTATKLTFAVVSTLYLVVAIPFEERSLVDAFGDQYRAYKGRVRWRMVPFIY